VVVTKQGGISSPTRAPAPAKGVRLHLAEDEGLLFDEVGQRLFHLNTMAVCIWCHIEDRRSLDSLIDAVAQSMNLDRRRARQFTLEMIGRWWRLGLLDGSRRITPAVRAGSPKGGAPKRIVAVDSVGSQRRIELRHYRLLDTWFSLDYADRKVESTVHPILAHLEQPRPAAGALSLHVVKTGEEWRVLQGPTLLGSCRSLRSLAPLMQGLLSLLAQRRYPFLLALHAAGIASADGAMLLVGKSRSGKTTLAATLMGKGWDYLSDDTILLQRRTLMPVGVPYSLGIKRGGWELLQSHFPGQLPPVEHLRADGQVVSYLSLPSLRSTSLPKGVRWIVFLSLSPGEDGDLRPLRPFEGMQRLVRHCCAIPRALLPVDIHRLVRWTRQVDWFDLKIGDLDHATARLMAIMAEQPSGSSEATAFSQLSSP
jgi:hypothetical protein